MHEIDPFLGQLVASCWGIRSVWLIGMPAQAEDPGRTGAWDLVAFADEPSLERLRHETTLHRSDVRMRVVTDNDRFGVAWGDLPGPGSLMQWDWVRTSPDDAFYSEARWQEPVEKGEVTRVRRKAHCVWRAPGEAS